MAKSSCIGMARRGDMVMKRVQRLEEKASAGLGLERQAVSTRLTGLGVIRKSA